MEKLREEIKRKQEEARILKERSQGFSKEPSQSNANESAKQLTFIRQKDRLLWNQTQLEVKQQNLEDERLSKKQKLLHETAPLCEKHPSASADSSHRSDTASSLLLDEKFLRFQQLSNRDLQMKLRALRQPITLFGEERDDRLQRLKEYLSKHPSKEGNWEDDEYRLQNKKREALVSEREEAAFDAEDERRPEDTNDTAALENSDSGSEVGEEKPSSEKATIGSDVVGSGEKKKSPSSVKYDPSILYHKMTNLPPEKIIYKFFRSLIKQWELDLHQRQEAEKLSMKGKLELKSQKQCKDHIRPLFKLCQQKAIPLDIQQKLLLMVTYCEDGNFMKANDEYIKTAIGNSAWPIGLTMVGIHERSGRERISTSKVAHIMNNEQERKYLTAVKRLMTYCQTKRPEVAPSMKVLS